ncbi:DUF3086 domain-containing protein [Lyngbya confervoides]|uniref:DUF3086 domain-containing protein n=1 Tax=Lyngbya confervoides BDU141951 TaxID=1574623 RepID=A0ABD4T052_9CYAN|nr:DUF3086 domain-containing protein [Lyngbya confervoides]MCM1982101.1 DUF3086 domain-containing protein [Lyngbya confervoides BDU141951]
MTNADQSPINRDNSLGSPSANLPSALQSEVETLRTEIESLKAEKSQLLAQQLRSLETVCERLAQANITDLEERQRALQMSVEQLERRQERVQAEMKRSFAGVSQDIAIRVQGFKDYLVASLQDLVTTAEQLDLPMTSPDGVGSPGFRADPQEPSPRSRTAEPMAAPEPQFSQQSFQSETRQIRKLINQFTQEPDYYGPPWKLRRTFEAIHAERVEQWFLKFGGRGALPSLPSRLQNILVASAIISILRNLYGHRVRTLILANTPERLGDWRRGLQDCLGVGRGDFGPERGVMLFESADSLSQKAERLISEDCLPFILMDDVEGGVSLALLQYPFWLVFAPENQPRRDRGGFDWFE